MLEGPRITPGHHISSQDVWLNGLRLWYTAERRPSPGIQACFELRMDASSTLHSTFVSNYVHELGSWTLGFRLFCVDRSFKKEILPFNTKTGEREPSHTPTSRAEKTHKVLYWNLRLFTQFPLLPIKLVVPCHNKLLLNIIPLWWHPSWCLKSPLKRVFAFCVLLCERPLRSFSAPLQSFLGHRLN